MMQENNKYSILDELTYNFMAVNKVFLRHLTGSLYRFALSVFQS